MSEIDAAGAGNSPGWAGAARVLVFSGHLFDRVGRPAPRFPVALASSAARAIGTFLDGEDSHSAFCSLSCGADILFAEEVLKREIRLSLVVAVDAAHSLEEVEELARQLGSDSKSAEMWARRARVIVDALDGERLHELHQTSTDDPGQMYRYTNDVMNRLAMEEAQRHAARVQPLVVWDGNRGDPGGTAEVVEHWENAGVPVSIVDANRLG